MTEDDVRKKIQDALGTIEVPGGSSLAEFPGLSDIIVTKGAVAFAISVSPGMETAFAPARTAAEQAAHQAAEGRKVMVSLTGDKAPAQAAPKGAAPRPGPPPKSAVPGIKHIVAVGSGKGGVGKSTCAVNIALGLVRQGLKVGILDADLYGPSLPKLLGIEGKPAVRDDGIFKPFEVYGLKAMSIGPMLTGTQAVVWRGPMATSALRQLLRETDWGQLDVLVVDLPPGTGDIQISLVQQVELAGAVIISTPQDLALIDAKKAIDMLARTNVPVLGIVENMSYFIAPDTGNRYDIFGHGGAKAAAGDMGIPFLGEIPLVMSIREGADAGKPAVSSGDGPDAQAFLAIAERLAATLSRAKIG
ncbi:Mrp/NBP35 family ATP-binding protein [Pelagibacterium nitratireducens]|uniref:Iron-sulfur cluster carrier protein n=1 Tax=Pelagibacterium nitratireducens TaxID=1046114 RepID=A0ABZ2I1P1_9HYPH|nr:sodium:proton antiporter [Pelagibacterium sp.]HCO54733.1 sodium:proton antiporter [Pelagibacterium sp.]